MKIINLTQHDATPEQIAAGVYEPKNKAYIRKLLTFDELPTALDVAARSEAIVGEIVHDKPDAAMLGGAPYLMIALDAMLRARGITPLYAFSMRHVEERKRDDGTVEKISVFKHAGFVKSPYYSSYFIPSQTITLEEKEAIAARLDDLSAHVAVCEACGHVKDFLAPRATAACAAYEAGWRFIDGLLICKHCASERSAK